MPQGGEKGRQAFSVDLERELSRAGKERLHYQNLNGLPMARNRTKGQHYDSRLWYKVKSSCSDLEWALLF